MNVFSRPFTKVGESKQLQDEKSAPSGSGATGAGDLHHRTFMRPRKDMNSILRSAAALVPPKRNNRKQELNEVEIEDIPKIYFEEGKGTEQLAVRFMLGELPADLNQESLQNHIIKQDLWRRRVQTSLVETIMKNYQGFVIGVQHVSSTETDLAWSSKYLVEGRNTLKYLEDQLITPSFKILNNHQALSRLSKVINIGRASRVLILQIPKLEKAVKGANFPESVQILDECNKIVAKYPQIRELSAMKGHIARFQELRNKLQNGLMDTLVNLCDNFEGENFEVVLTSFDALISSTDAFDVEYNFDIEFRSAMLSKVENICIGVVLSLIENSKAILERFSRDEDISVKFTEACTSVPTQTYVKCINILFKRLGKSLNGYLMIANRLKNARVQGSYDENSSPALERLRAAVWSNRSIVWEKMLEFLQMLLTTQKITSSTMDEILNLLMNGQKFILIGDKFVEGFLDADGILKYSTSGNFSSGTSTEQTNSSISSQRLKEPLLMKCREYLQSFVKDYYKSIRSAMAADPWVPLSVDSKLASKNWKDLYTLRHSNESDTSLDADALFNRFVNGEEVFDSADNLFNSEVEDKKIDIIDEIKMDLSGDSASSQSESSMIVTQTTIAALSFYGKLAMLLKLLSPAQEETLEHIFELFHFYVYLVFSNFGIRTHSFFQEYTKVKSRYPNLFQVVNICRAKFKKGKLGGGVFGQEPPISAALDPKTAPPPPVGQINAVLSKKLENEAALRGFIERYTSVESIKFMIRVYKWSIVHLKSFLSKDILSRFENFVNEAFLLENEFETYLIRNFADLMIPTASYAEVRRKILAVNWCPTEILDAVNPYVDDFIGMFKAFDTRFTQALSVALNLPSKMKELLWKELIIFAFESLVDFYSEVSKCTPEGRALMSEDFRNIVRSLNTFSPIKPLPNVDYVKGYIKLYDYPDPESFIKWINDHPVYRPKHFERLCTFCTASQGLTTKKAKEDFKDQVLKAASKQVPPPPPPPPPSQ